MNNAITGNTPRPEPQSQTDWARVAAMTDEEIALDEDNPRTTEADWEDAIASHSYAELHEKLAERRRRGAQKAPRKEQVAIRFSPDVLAYFRATGKGWQTRIDTALREWIHHHSPVG